MEPPGTTVLCDPEEVGVLCPRLELEFNGPTTRSVALALDSGSVAVPRVETEETLFLEYTLPVLIGDIIRSLDRRGDNDEVLCRLEPMLRRPEESKGSPTVTIS